MATDYGVVFTHARRGSTHRAVHRPREPGHRGQEIGRGFDVGPIFDALAERGRVVARRAYADWTLFAGDRRTLVEHNCELIDIPQRDWAVRKNAADIKLAVDAMELAYERGFVSTFVIASGDSDFTPLVAALWP